ncbi:class I SAM-dependent methyltransferase [Clostridium sp. SHJSY1]|uniref:class I SAM-dependent methyltransferase n=1 Tax=Clostridium sp. SHJSY1 TaxID=2942483 RepID=UPI0028764ADE|nr:class I SAM-dependent methyltransferase [Clostridium sp. SHJSY1]MDS0525592.1 class I SAM-dependent methyltransferase [Clostridium sp. SHJSY1]
MIDIIFDQYQRYKNAKIIIDSIRENNETFKILEVGANAHKNLEKFLPNDDVTYLDISLPEELLHDPKYILGDATNMNFKNGEYDVVIALDVFEHIPVDRREAFISEIHRVSSKVAIISAPFNKAKVTFAEERANAYYKSIIGLDHHWLYEHINNGLPDLIEVENYLKSNNIQYNKFAHGNLSMWEKLTNIQALLQLDKELEKYVIEINKYYNSFVFDKDYDEDGYREFIILEKGKKFKCELEYKSDTKDLEVLIDNLYQLFNIRMSMGLVNPILPGRGDNIIKLYIDYGMGFSESETLYKNIELSNLNNVKFDNFKDNKIKSIRIDPTESQGKFIFRDLVVKNKNNEVIENVDVTTNAFLKDDDMYIFLNKDPQIVINFEEELINSIGFTIQKIKDYSSEDQILYGAIMKKFEEVKQMEISNAELIKISTEGFVKKVKKKMSK